MIPTKTNEFTVTSTLEGDDIEMSIDQDAVTHLMSVLTELYSNPTRACVREYATNAWDSHIAAGVTDPIEVVTPNSLSPTFRVIDHGLGLDADDIRDIYSMYGKSTKTDSNEYNGVLGLGCKSALAYSNQFSVTGIKNGIRTLVAVTRDEEGIGTMTIMDQRETDERNGVIVEIPAKAGYNTFYDEAVEFFKYWPQDRVLVNGEPVATLEGMLVTEGIRLINEMGQNTVVMGGVPYPLVDTIDNEPIFNELTNGYRVVAEVPIGSVHFAPSREALKYTKRTKKVVKEIADAFKSSLGEAISREVDKAPTPIEALKLGATYRSALDYNQRDTVKLTYKGEDLPEVFKVPAGDHWRVTGGKEEHDWYGKRKNVGKSSTSSQINWNISYNGYWIYGHTSNFIANHKHRLWKYFEDNGLALPEYFILCQEKPNSKWIDPARILDWEPISKIKLPRHARQTGAGPTPTGGKVKTGSYDGATQDYPGPHEILASEINDRAPLYYVERRSQLSRYANILDTIMDEYTIVYVTGNRLNKFKRLFPDAVHPHQIVQDAANWWWEEYLTERERGQIRYTSDYTVERYLRILPATGVQDWRFHTMRYLSNVSKELLAHAQKLQRYITVNQSGIDCNWVQEDYPLLDSISRYRSDDDIIKSHCRTYVNAIYQENNA